MKSRFILEDEDITILGEKEKKNGENSSVGDTSSNDRVNASSNNE